ncbi:MAG: ROK family protein, partial [Desulfobacterales bacterium]|nr:ROK family protein [Desulfobacterales bacterium]
MLDETYEVLNADNNLRIEFSTGDFEHKVLVGVDYTLFEQDRREGFSCGGFTSVTCSGLVPAPLDLSEPNHRAGIQAEFTNAFTTRSTQIGYYLQDQIKYRDRVSLVLGVRRDKSTSEVSGVKEEPNEATSVRVGVIVDVGAGLSPYAGYSESYLPVFGGDFFGNPFKPKEGEQYEVGVKWQPNNTTLVTFAWFDVEETNRLTSDPDNLQNMLQSGKVGAKGYEIEATSTLFKSLNLTAAYSYTDAEVLSDNSGQQGLAVDNLPLAQQVTEATGLPCYLSNFVSSMALAEHKYGASQSAVNSLLVTVHNGVGAGMVLDGKLYESSSLAVGEIGHVQIDPFGKQCYCGNYGCLETLVSNSALENRCREMLSAGVESSLTENADIHRICQAASLGDQLACRLLRDAATHLGKVIAMSVNLLRPDAVVLSGDMFKAWDVVHPVILHALQSQTVTLNGNPLTDVIPGKLYESP